MRDGSLYRKSAKATSYIDIHEYLGKGEGQLMISLKAFGNIHGHLWQQFSIDGTLC